MAVNIFIVFLLSVGMLFVNNKYINTGINMNVYYIKHFHVVQIKMPGN